MFPYRRLPSSAEAAEIIGTSRASLYRSLANEGITYFRVVERVRFEAARSMLKDESSSIKEIAYELGYSSPGSFVRAFRRLSGVTPGEFRRRQHR